MPREPSTPRIAIWRELRDIGVAQIGDGLVALPTTDRNRERLEWLAAKALEAGGEAIVWDATPTAKRDRRALAQQLQEARNHEYGELMNEISDTAEVSQRTIKRWRRQWRAIDKRDYFNAPNRDVAKAAIDAHAQLQSTGATR